MCAAVADAAGPSEAKWENPLQVVARNRQRGGSSGGNIADLDMGEEEVHQLLADLVSATPTFLGRAAGCWLLLRLLLLLLPPL